MPEVRAWENFYAFNRYAPGANPYSPGIILDGRNFVFRGEPPVPQVHNGIAAAGQTPGQNTTIALGSTWASIAQGGGILWRNNSIWYNGQGQFYVDGAPIGTPNGVLRVHLSGAGGDFPAGLPAPTLAPALAATGTSQKMRGSYGLVYCWGRSSTGARSNPSPPADISLTNQLMRATFAVVPSGFGIDQIWLFGTPRGLGTVGPFKTISKYNPVLVSTLTPGRTKDLEWNDNELGATFAPIASFQPPVSPIGYVVAFGNCMVVLGCYGGAGIAFSGDDPESFDPLDVIFAEPFEPINGVWTRGADGFALFSTPNSLQAVYPAGGSVKVAIRRLWGEDGIPAGNKGGAIVRGQFYCYTSAGPGRLTGEGKPDDTFARDVQAIMRASFNPAEVVVGYNPVDQEVLYCGAFGGGYVAFPYRIFGDYWGPPVGLPAKPVAAVTYGTRCYIVVGNQLREYDAPGGILTGTAYLRSGFEQGSAGGDRINLDRAILKGSAGISSRLYRAEEDDDPPSFASPITGPSSGQGWVPTYAPRAHAIACEVLGTAPGQVFHGFHAEGFIDPRRAR